MTRTLNLEHKSQLIVCSAAKFEVNELLCRLEVLKFPYTFIELGIGAIRSTQIAMMFRKIAYNRSILFAGSCGTSAIFDEPHIIAAKSAIWHPGEVRSGQGYLVQGAEPRVILSKLPDSFSVAHEEISCSGSISLASEPAASVFENLELYGVASAWAPVAKNFYAILGVTNRIGANAHNEWKSNFQSVAKLSANLFTCTNQLESLCD